MPIISACIFAKTSDFEFKLLDIHTWDVHNEEGELDIPDTLRLEGMLHDDSDEQTEQFFNHLLSILEEKGMEDLIQTWIDDNSNTLLVTVAVGNYIVISDLLNNLTSCFTHPGKVEMLLFKIRYEMQKYIDFQLYTPKQKEGWYHHQLNNWRTYEEQMKKLQSGNQQKINVAPKQLQKE